MRPKISVIITNWNGFNIINKSLEVILQNSPEADEFIFIDDGSTDQSVSYVKSLQKTHPKLKLISQKKNRGFIHSSNKAVSQASGDLIVLLNNDIFPKNGYIKNSLPHFKDPLVFGVGFCESNNPNYPRFFWKSGYIQYEPVPNPPKAHITAWLSGGSSIIRKKYFDKLKGFDPVYAPFYSEDLDLGYRAWKSGYKLIWEPKSIVEHHHGTTISKLPKRLVNYVKERNRLLTVYRNITDPKLLKNNRINLILRVLSGPNYIKIIRAAKKQTKKFPKPVVFPKLTDRQIFNLFR